MPGFNFDALRETIKKGNKTIYGSGNDMPFFDLFRKESWNESEKRHQHDIRIVQKPGTNGYGYRVIHSQVGYPGKDPKTFVCPKFFDTDIKKNDCPLCDAYAMHKDPELEEVMMDWPDYKDGIPVIKSISVSEVLKKLQPGPRLVLVVCEPVFLNDESADPKLRGLQVFYIQKRTLVKRITETLKEYPGDYFTDPENGHAIRVIHSPNSAPTDMYGAVSYIKMPFPKSLQDKAPDAEQFTGKVKPIDQMQTKLAEMLPGLL